MFDSASRDVYIFRVQTLRTVTGFWFYLLGLVLLAAYVSLRGEIFGVWPAYALQYLDLPFILSGLLYGGLNLYFSVKSPGKKSQILGIIIGVIVGVMFLGAAVMNFWI